jgi:DNA ligase (NAD+)
MYTAAETKQLQKTTAELLKHPAGPLTEKELKSLREVLRFHEHRYYILNDPLISDYEYDQLYKWLGKTEGEDPSRITPDSPTQRVALGITREFVTVQHLVPMLSLENSYNAEDLRDWDRKARELSGLDVLEYSVEPKFDGASISLIYDHDLLERGATRGDGAYGDDITTNIRQIKSVPLSAKFSERGIQRVEIRGEVLLTKEHFKKFNDQLMAQGTPPLANPRNAAAGSLRMKDPKEVSRRNLEAFLYHISFVEAVPRKQPSQQLQHHSQCLELLWELGFRSPVNEVKVLKGIEQVIAHCLAFEQERDNLPYEIDGMVIKVNDTVLQEKLGMTSHHPRWAIAYKFKARQATSTLLAVEYQVGRTGSVTPVAKIEPVPIGGVTVSSISLFNEEVIKEKDLMIGDSVLVERAGDVIPYIVKSLADVRKGTEKKIHFPRHCPVCGSSLEKPEAEAVWRCNNFDCPAQVVERIIHFTSKDAMDIRGFGEANIRKFVDLGLLQDIPGIYSLPYDKIRELEGFGDKSVQKLQQAIESSKEQPLHRLLFALGIRYVGETTAKVLANAVQHILDFQEKTIEELQEMEDVGPKVASSIHAFFHDKGNLQLIKKLEAIGLKVTSEKKTIHREGALADKTFLFTGTLTALKRSEAESMVEEKGGKLLSGVSSKLDYLVVGEDAGSKLEKAKKIPSVKILTEEEFLRLAGKGT